jgi:GH25 family lysozyme M1 (1,4-beta-N-acetylmuramidase)
MTNLVRLGIRSFLGTKKIYPINGFDVSEGVGLVNWGMVAQSPKYNFTSFRACFGKGTDDQWYNNLAGVKGIGNYPWYPYFVPKFGNWEAETDYFLSLYDAAGGSPMPPEIDVEYKYNPLNKAQTCTWLEKSAMKISAVTGYDRLLVYSSKSYWDTHVETRDYFRRFTDLEAAQWNSVIDEPDLIPNDWKNLPQPWVIWQWWNKTEEPFAPGDIDSKRFYGTNEDFIAKFDVNPYYAEITPPPPPQPLEGLVFKVIQDGLKIRTAPSTSAPIVGTLSANELLEAINVGGKDSWIQHSRGWSNVQDGADINMVKAE